MYTYSPTATRTGHRMVVVEASLKGWEIWSLDVSTAFLKGWTFEEMNKSGFKRQPCALRLPTDVWELLAELEPSNKLFKFAARNPELYCLELDKAAYGLKDAPLLWNLKAVLVLVSELQYIRSSHDSCLFYRVSEGRVVVVISLHVDDTLATGELWALTELHQDLEKRFGAMKAEKNSFRHFGVDISRNSNKDVQMCQKNYIANLKPISRKKEKGRTVESDANTSEITDYRSLVSGIAWVGITSPALKQLPP